MLQHLIIHFSLHYLSTGRLREVKNKLLAQKVVAVAYERFFLQQVPNILIWHENFWHCGKLVETGDSTVPVVFWKVELSSID